MICPFCGKVSDSSEHCTRCHVEFNDEIRAVALKEDTRSDRVGPVSTKTAKIMLWAFMALLLVAFIAVTELGSSWWS